MKTMKPLACYLNHIDQLYLQVFFRVKLSATIFFLHGDLYRNTKFKYNKSREILERTCKEKI